MTLSPWRYSFNAVSRACRLCRLHVVLTTALSVGCHPQITALELQGTLYYVTADDQLVNVATALAATNPLVLPSYNSQKMRYIPPDNQFGVMGNITYRVSANKQTKARVLTRGTGPQRKRYQPGRCGHRERHGSE